MLARYSKRQLECKYLQAAEEEEDEEKDDDAG
jgi:hypothetical protein